MVKNELIKYKGGCCEVCRYDKCFDALIFHHRNPSEKDFIIAGNHARKLEHLKNEVDKCALLCNRCHSEIHAGFIKLS
jgi:hypothetical protein